MKRILFCAGILALAASCTESELDTISVQEGSKNGITFQEENASSRGGWVPGDGEYVPQWYAETDKIAVWGTKISGKIVNTATDFGNEFVTANKLVYKATKSAQKGEFTAINDDNILSFDRANNTFKADDKKTHAQFFAVYPSTLAATHAVVDGVKAFTIPLLSVNLGAQAQKDLLGDGIFDNVVRWSASTGFPENTFDAVGEKIKLNFRRSLSGLVFSTVNADKYTKGDKSIFGKLKTITLVALGDKATGATANTADKLTLGADAAIVVDVTDIENPTAVLKADAAGNAAASTIVWTANAAANGLEWSDAAKAYMVVAPIERKDKAQHLTIEYAFANITLKVPVSTTNSWVAGAIHEVSAIDIDKYSKHLVTNKGTNNDRKLIINEGTLASVLDVTANGVTTVKWNGAKLAIAEFSDIICNVALSDEEFKSLKSFTSVKNITLNKNTSIPADAFKTFAGLLSIDMPMVTTINEKAFVELTALESLKLKSYEFKNEKVNALFFNADTDGTLKTLDISGVANMAPEYNNYAKLSFSGYTALTSVTLKEGASLAGSAFNGCTALDSVSGTVKLSENAFEGCTALKTINIVGTVIPENAFNGCTLLTKVNKGQIVPTEVGALAFKGTAIAYMDLSKITKLGKSAFAGCTKLATTSATATDLTVSGLSIPLDAFKGCVAIKTINFTEATSFEAGILEGCIALRQVKFHKVFTVGASAAWDDAFGTPASIDLFTAVGQEGVAAKVLSLLKAAKTETAEAEYTDVTFKTINKTL